MVDLNAHKSTVPRKPELATMTHAPVTPYNAAIRSQVQQEDSRVKSGTPLARPLLNSPRMEVWSLLISVEAVLTLIFAFWTPAEAKSHTMTTTVVNVTILGTITLHFWKGSCQQESTPLSWKVIAAMKAILNWTSNAGAQMKMTKTS